MYTVTEDYRAERKKALMKAFKRGHRRATGQHMDDREAEYRADKHMAALPQLYGIGEHEDVKL